jgi:EAL domain-containing protein (putative c-di-GMP-specific phosphodiesterase class I)
VAAAADEGGTSGGAAVVSGSSEETTMARQQRTEAAQQVAELLRTARESLGLSLAFMTRMDGTTQHLEVVDSSIPWVFRDGGTQRQDTSFCQAIMDGRLPAVMPDVRNFPEAMKLPAARNPRIRSFVSVPMVLSDGTVYGTFCAAGFGADKALSKRDKALMEVLSRAASLIIEPGVQERARNAEIETRLRPVIDDGGPVVLLQPIVDLATRRRVGTEALSRFPQQWHLPPDRCFADADLIGERERLELLALERAGEYLDRVSGYVAMNVSPATLFTRDCLEFLDRLPLDRVVLELSEHEPIEDYDSLKAVLAPLRARGMRLAIDDVGAGFSSLRHIVVTAPDVIKLDRSIVTGLTDDPVLAVVVHSLVDLARATGAQVVAEGVETEEDAVTLARLGAGLGQGWHFGRATPADQLRDQYPAYPVGAARAA